MAAITEKNVNNYYIQRLDEFGYDVSADKTSKAAGLLIFLGIVTMLYEIIIILQRFINVKIINRHILAVIILVRNVWST